MNQINKPVCPRCDGQGLVERILIKPLSLEAYLCDECSAMWLKKEDISFDNFLEFGPFVWEKGLKGTASEIDYLD